MPDLKLLMALLITIVLALLIFRTNYSAAPSKVTKAKYWIKDKYNYMFLLLDLASAITYAIIGCYLSWDSITTIEALKQFAEYRFLISILTGAVFQQALPIILEIAMNKLNSFKASIGDRQ